jgi:hypothetical protein
MIKDVSKCIIRWDLHLLKVPMMICSDEIKVYDLAKPNNRKDIKGKSGKSSK